MHGFIRSSQRAARAALWAVMALSAATACSDNDLTTATTPVATSLVIVSGSGQAAGTNAALAAPLSVKVLDQDGNAMSGIAVSWTIMSGGGALSAALSATNAAGVAATTYTTGANAGTSKVNAVASGLSAVTFSITVSSP